MRTDEEITFLKAEICDRIGDGTLTTHATLTLGISWRELARWQKDDPDFRDELKTAQEQLTEIKADALTTIHETIPNVKRAQVASNNLRWWLAKRRPEVFGESGERPSDEPQLLDILRAAIGRIPRPSEPPMKTIEASPVRGPDVEG